MKKLLICRIIFIIFAFSVFSTLNASAQESIKIIACSDFQNQSGLEAGKTFARDLLTSLKNTVGITTADGLLFCGDYDASTINNYTATVNGINALKEVFSGTVDEENMIFTQGNHDSAEAECLAVSGNNDKSAYGVFVINEDDYMWYGNDEERVKETANNLKAYLDEKITEKYQKPIFILSHLPLHYTARTEKDGDGQHARYLFDVINSSAARGLNIIFLFGHNHSGSYDDYLGASSICLKKGDDINIANSMSEYTREKLNFTYLNPGYIGYYSTSTTGADRSLTMTLFEIKDNEVIISRYDTDGLHNLKSAGVRTDSIYSDGGVYPSLQAISNQTVIILGEETEAVKNVPFDFGQRFSGAVIASVYDLNGRLVATAIKENVTSTDGKIAVYAPEGLEIRAFALKSIPSLKPFKIVNEVIFDLSDGWLFQ